MIEMRLHEAAGGRRIGEIILDNPRALNALSPPLISGMQAALDEWRQDGDVAAAVLRGAGERAFCAGGDVRHVRALAEQGDMAGASAYFASEYCLDYALHCFSKPLLGWGGGVIMGGGMGVYQACHLRVALPSAKMAMPEGKIGFFPDVGAAFFMKCFNPAPHAAHALGFCGAVFGATEALRIGAADMMLPEDGYDDLLSDLRSESWDGDALEIMQRVAGRQRIAAGSGGGPDEAAFEDCGNALLDGDFDKAASALPADYATAARAASPLSVRVWAEYCRRMRHVRAAPRPYDPEARLRLREVLATDYALALNFLHCGEFAEGVRALLIDKDNAPRWSAPFDDESVAAMFVPPDGDVMRRFEEALANAG